MTEWILGGLVFLLLTATVGFITDFFGDPKVRADLKILWNEWREK
jgi:hypothetical protein